MNLIIDGSSLLWRSHHVNKSKGEASLEFDTYLFIKSLRSYVKQFNADDVYIAWDKKLVRDTPNFRIESNPDYKGTRDKSEAELVYTSQSTIHKITKSLGCLNIYPGIMEADDVIAWLTHNLDERNIIVSSDKDMLQLVTSNTTVYHPMKKTLVSKTNFEEEVGVPQHLFVAYKAILGDSSDNIKGVRGYGKVKAKKLAKDYIDGNVSDESMLETIEENVKLMDLSVGYNIAGDFELKLYQKQLESKTDISCNIEEFSKYCKELKFDSITEKMSEWEACFDEPPLLKMLKNSKFSK